MSQVNCISVKLGREKEVKRLDEFIRTAGERVRKERREGVP